MTRNSTETVEKVRTLSRYFHDFLGILWLKVKFRDWQENLEIDGDARPWE